MTRALVFAYHFPPVGGGGVQRNAKFIRYLPEHSFEPIVITGPGVANGRWTPEDRSLLDEVSKDVDVRRVSGPEPEADIGLRSAVSRRLMLKSGFIRWWLDGALSLGREVVADVDLIYASLVPYDTAEVAAELSRDSGRPWVADLQDPWALDEMWLYPSRIHQLADLRRMRRLLGTASAVVMNTPEAATRLLRRFPELGRRIVVSIPNGFDASDFTGPVVRRGDDRFRIVHTGTLHTATGLRLRKTRRVRRLVGGMAEDIDILPRSHFYLVRALERLSVTEPDLVSRVEVVLAGVTSPVDREVAESSPVEMHFPGYLPHRETIDLMRSADLLFLPMHDLPQGVRAGLVPGKTYEYLASGRPILGAVGDGDARELLLEAGNTTVCPPSDDAALARAIGSYVRRWQEGVPEPNRRVDVLARYERRRQTRDLASVLDRTLALSST